jgi:hypothetical protein
MGTVYCGPYTDQICGYDHEGYAARIRPDGSETGTWTYETREFRGYRAHCDCGWRGSATYPPTDRGEEAALEEWDHDHLRPMITAEARRHTITAEVLLAFADELRQTALDRSPDGGREVLAERARGLLDAVDRLHQLLDDHAQTDHEGR